MAGKTIIIGIIFLSFVLVFGGCGRGSRETPKEIAATPSELHRAELQNTISRKFENPQAHYELGQSYQAEGLWAQAEYHYNIAMSFDPSHRPAQAAMINCLRASGDTAKADTTADVYISQVSGSAEESLRLALAFQKERLDNLALTCYQQALRLAPNSAKINRQIGYYYMSKQDLVRAKEYLYRSFQLNPNQPEVAGELGRLGVDVTGARAGSNVKKLDRIVTDSEKDMQ
jgi:Tfp pilus assembly protein PilF